MKKFIYTTDSSSWLRPNDDACLFITSPTAIKGSSYRTICIGKTLAMLVATESEKELIKRCVGDETVRRTDMEVSMTKAEFESLVRLSNL